MKVDQEKIVNFINEQTAQAEFRAKAYVFNDENEKRPKRSIYIKLKAYFNNFLKGDSSIRWVTLTGLRGAGKTTLLSQLYWDFREKDCYKLMLSVDAIVKILNSQIANVIETFEDLIGYSLESLDKPLLLFLDEVQYDKKWGDILKIIYDRSPKVFILATGSAALSMNINTDNARRTVYEKLFPLSFTEYLKIKFKKFPIKNLSQEVKTAFFDLKTSQEVYDRLKEIEKKANQYYLGVTRYEFEKYLNYGSLPFMITVKNESLIYDQIAKSLDRVINLDIAQSGGFGSDIIAKLPGILYAVSDMDAFNFSTLSQKFEISRPTVIEIFNLLEQTEILNRIYPKGSHLNQTTKKPSKYLFSSPAFRSMYYKTIGNIINQKNAKGKLMEDLIAMYLIRILYKNPIGSLVFDSAQGGADFIFSKDEQKIIIEVGAGKKDFSQIIKTAKKVNSKYNLIISEDSLTHNSDLKTVKIPLRLFLLI
jgi:hypothetical protein